MHGGEEIWECVCASIRSSGFFFFGSEIAAS